jgi:hypothetical protein
LVELIVQGTALVAREQAAAAAAGDYKRSGEAQSARQECAPEVAHPS